MNYQTKAQQQQEADRAQRFHKWVTVVIVCGFALVVVMASVLVMVVS